MTTRRGGLVALGTFLLFLTGAAPGVCGEISLDLAGGDSSFLLTAGEETKVSLHNRIPGASYETKVARKGGLLTAFPVSALGGGSASSGEADAEDPAACADTLSRLYTVTEESQLPGRIFQAKAETLSAPGCRQLVEEFEAKTSRVLLDSVTVASGEAVIVDICRPDLSGADGGRICWTFTLESGETRRWLTHFGFAFLPDEDERYFAQASEDGDGFSIARQGDGDDELDYEPTITFTYIPDTVADRSAWKPYFTAGLGVDVVDDPVVFAGMSWVVGDNVNLFLGGAFHEQDRLKGIYDDGQALEMTLTEDQLHDTRFGVNAIAGIGFRFDGNPFRSGDSETKVEPAQPDEESDDDDGGAADPEPDEDSGTGDEEVGSEGGAKTGGEEPEGGDDETSSREGGGSEGGSADAR